MNSAFSTPHPSLRRFVAQIGELAVTQEQLRSDVLAKRASQPKREPIILPKAVNVVRFDYSTDDDELSDTSYSLHDSSTSTSDECMESNSSDDSLES